MFSSANVVTGQIMSVSSSVVSFFNLRDENRQLSDRNKLLELKILSLQRQLETMRADAWSNDDIQIDSLADSYEYIAANVVNNSVTHLLNYITINKGSKDGIEPDMGVISTYGVVGIVRTVNKRFSVIIPLLNPKWGLSCKLLNSNFYGTLVWNGRDTQHANLEELPTHAEFHEGDTVVTSGFSAIFPPGIMVGTVEKSDISASSGFYSLNVKLATNFHNLSTVWIVKNYFQKEQWALEREARKND
jgi:rod shape-determining protein MreC